MPGEGGRERDEDPQGALWSIDLGEPRGRESVPKRRCARQLMSSRLTFQSAKIDVGVQWGVGAPRMSPPGDRADSGLGPLPRRARPHPHGADPAWEGERMNLRAEPATHTTVISL